MVSQTPKILIVASSGLSSEQIATLQNRFQGRAELIPVPDQQEPISKNIGEAHALIGCPRAFFDPALLSAGKNLEWVHVGGAGCEEFLFPEFIESPITLTSGKIIQGPEVADHALALLLCLTRNLHHLLLKNRETLPRPLELRGKTGLVIGCGGIGSLIAERAAGFGMKMIGVTPDYIPMLSLWEKWFDPKDLCEALPLADVVFMAAPLTPDTKNKMGKKEFAAMKKGSFFINVSRGKTVDTEALQQALMEGHLRGAGLDVTEPEPLSENHPLRTLSQVVITPHVAGPSDKNRERSFTLIGDNIERFVAKKALINIINKRLGY